MHQQRSQQQLFQLCLTLGRNALQSVLCLCKVMLQVALQPPHHAVLTECISRVFCSQHLDDPTFDTSNHGRISSLEDAWEICIAGVDPDGDCRSGLALTCVPLFGSGEISDLRGLSSSAAGSVGLAQNPPL